MSNKQTGSCLCKAIKYEATLDSNKVHVCHCTICQKWHGGPALGLKCQPDWKIEGENFLTWFDSSEHAKRAFCSKCGTNLICKTNAGEYCGVSAGTLDNQKDLEIEGHIFIDFKPAYYDFSDNSPRLTEQEFLEHVGAA